MACAELCGVGHFAMKKLVVVLEQEEFSQWYNEQNAWLTRHPEYLSKIPQEHRELAENLINQVKTNN